MPSSEFWSMRITDVINFAILIATIVAIVYGPIKAVEMTRQKDRDRDHEARKRQILAALMRTRRITMHPDHVGALNQIQLEFLEHPSVITAYRNYIANLSEQVPLPGNALENFLNRRNDLFFDLLHEVSLVVGLTIDRRDLDRLSYVPLGWQTEEDEVRSFRRSVIETLEGRRPLYVAPFHAPPAAHNPFPPPPASG